MKHGLPHVSIRWYVSTCVQFKTGSVLGCYGRHAKHNAELVAVLSSVEISATRGEQLSAHPKYGAIGVYGAQTPLCRYSSGYT